MAGKSTSWASFRYRAMHGTEVPFPQGARAAARSRSAHHRHGQEPGPAYALRNRTEHFLNRPKNSRRVAARCGQTADSRLGFSFLASVRLWIRFVRVV